MTPDQIEQITTPLFSQGLPGTIAVIAGYVAWFMWRTREKDRVQADVVIAAKDALIKELYEKRIDEGRVLIGVVQKNDMVMEQFSRAVNAKVVL
jgi:hypothetical protein